MASEIDVWNMALSTTGSKASISSKTENSAQANICRLWYDLTREVVLKAASWPCAMKDVSLAVLAERDFDAAWASGDPVTPWRFAYAEPSDLLAPRYLSSFESFSRGVFDGKSAIYTSTEDAVLRYTFDQTDVSRWDTGLLNAVVCYLAARITPGVTGKPNQRRELLQEAYEIIQMHQTELANEQDTQYFALPDPLVARGYGGAAQQQRYFYPYADILGGENFGS